MVGETATRMDALDIAAFLSTQGTGVLSMADDGDSYAVPLSFAFDDEHHDLYFRMGYGPESRKRGFVESGGIVSFVVAADTDEGWKSVVARGRLEVLSESTLDSAIVESVRKLDIPYFRVHDRPARNTTFNIVRLDVTELSGIVEA